MAGIKYALNTAKWKWKEIYLVGTREVLGHWCPLQINKMDLQSL